MKQYVLFLLSLSCLIISPSLFGMTKTSDYTYEKIKKLRTSHTTSPIDQQNSPSKSATTNKSHKVACDRIDCKKVFPTNKLFKQHILQGHNTSTREMAQYIMIDSHFINRALSQGDLRCPDCHESFTRKNRGNLMRHFRRSHGIHPFFCMHNLCLKNFYTNRELKTHQTLYNHKPAVKKTSKKIACPPEFETVIDRVMSDDTSQSATEITTQENYAHESIESIFDPLNQLESVMDIVNEPPLKISDYHQLDVATDSLLQLSPFDPTFDYCPSSQTPKQIWLPLKSEVWTPLRDILLPDQADTNTPPQE